MKYDDQIIDQVQSANDIVDVIGQSVSLKRAGRNFKGLCPFHEEKTPSFMVSAEKQIYHCFGCGAGGDVFGFLMRQENMTFPEALRQLADRANILLPERGTKSGQGGGDRSENERMYEIYELAADYFQQQFLAASGKPAREYFVKRGFSLDTAKEFRVGWASDAWRGLFEHLSRKGVSEALQLKARLINRSASGHTYDIFRGRLMFPIHNLQGKVVAFGGRLIGEGEGPKYLNSPENPVFIKRRELFGLHAAKKHLDRDLPRIVLVEGYLDFFRLYEAGFKTTAATLGTALGSDHVHVLKRFVQEAIVVYDGDKAGESASLRGADAFLEGGLNVRLVQLPEGEDPDDFVRTRGVEDFRKLVENSREFFDYKLDILLRRFKPADTLGLMRITNESMDTLVKVTNPVILDRYLKKLSGVLGIDESSLRQEYQKLQGKNHKSSAPAKAALQPSGAAATLQSANRDEIFLLGLLVDEPLFSSRAFEDLEASDFEHHQAQALFSRLKTFAGQGGKWTWPQILNRIEEESFKRQLVVVTSLDWGPGDKEKAFEDCLRGVKKKRMSRRLEELRREIAKAERLGEKDLVLAYTKQYQSLLQQIR